MEKEKIKITTEPDKEKLKAIIIRLADRLEDTEKKLHELQKQCTKTCEEVLAILRDNENYHKFQDFTETKRDDV